MTATPVSSSAAAADAMPAFEILDVSTKRPACDGGGGALGHPRVYLNMGSQTQVTCPYCSRTFRWVAGQGSHDDTAH